jgi:predicted regulator of Ras-like GTPase activity (Roadblock/LC7/MglB family)
MLMNHTTQTAGQPDSATLEGALAAAYGKGGLDALVLASASGLPIATVPDEYTSDTTAALVAVLQKAGAEAQRQLGLSDVDEVTIRTRDGARLVCRQIDLEHQTLLLIASVPAGTFYRRVTNRAVATIKKALS